MPAATSRLASAVALKTSIVALQVYAGSFVSGRARPQATGRTPATSTTLASPTSVRDGQDRGRGREEGVAGREVMPLRHCVARFVDSASRAEGDGREGSLRRRVVRGSERPIAVKMTSRVLSVSAEVLLRVGHSLVRGVLRLVQRRPLRLSEAQALRIQQATLLRCIVF